MRAHLSQSWSPGPRVGLAAVGSHDFTGHRTPVLIRWGVAQRGRHWSALLTDVLGGAGPWPGPSHGAEALRVTTGPSGLLDTARPPWASDSGPRRRLAQPRRPQAAAAAPARPWRLGEKRGRALRVLTGTAHGCARASRPGSPRLQLARPAGQPRCEPGHRVRKSRKASRRRGLETPGCPRPVRTRGTARRGLAGRLKAGVWATASGSGRRTLGSLAVPSGLCSHCPHSVPLLLTRGHKGF